MTDAISCCVGDSVRPIYGNRSHHFVPCHLWGPAAYAERKFVAKPLATKDMVLAANAYCLLHQTFIQVSIPRRQLPKIQIILCANDVVN